MNLSCLQPMNSNQCFLFSERLLVFFFGRKKEAKGDLFYLIALESMIIQDYVNIIQKEKEFTVSFLINMPSLIDYNTFTPG